MSGQYDMKEAIQKLQPVFDRLFTHLSAGDWTKLRSVTEDYMTSDLFDSHRGSNLLEDLIPHPEIRDLAGRLVEKCLQEVKDIDRMLPGQRKDLEYSALYTQQAWICWQNENASAAWTAVIRARKHFQEPKAMDLLQQGVVAHATGRKNQGWAAISQALLMDTTVEDRRPAFRPALTDIVHDRLGLQVDLDTFAADHRCKHAQLLPNISLIDLGGDPVPLQQEHGKITFLNFFSASCGSCRQEIASLGEFCRSYSECSEVSIVFILNQPEQKGLARELFEEGEIVNPIVTVLKTGSAYDLISEEPTIWVVDGNSEIVARHAGYRSGDENRYSREIDLLLKG